MKGSSLIKGFLFLLVIISFIFGFFTGRIVKNYPEIEGKNPFLSFRIIHVGDTHLYFQENSVPGGLGFSRMFSFLKYLKDKDNTQTIFTDSGDTFHGDPRGSLGKGRVAIKTWNEINKRLFDVYQAPGNHDFDWGDNLLKERNIYGEKINWPLLSANTRFVNDSTKTFLGNDQSQYKIISLNKDGREIKIGVFGLTTPHTKNAAPRKMVSHVQFVSAVKAAKEAVHYLKEKGCKFIVAITHLGLSYPNVKEEGTSVGVMNKVKDVDLILDGHTHAVSQFIPRDRGKYNHRLITNVGSGLTGIGITEIKFLLTPSNNLRNIIVSDRIVSKESIDNLKGGGVIIGNDQKIDSFISEEEKKIAKELDKPITNSLGDQYILDKHHPLISDEKNSSETNLANFTTDICRFQFESDLTIIHNGMITDSVPEGYLTTRKLINAYRTAIFVRLYEFSGKLIKSLLKQSFFSELGKPSFLQVSNLTAKVDRDQKKITDVKINQRPVNDQQKYLVATSIYPDSIPQVTDTYLKKNPEIYKLFPIDSSRSYLHEFIIDYLINSSEISLPDYYQLNPHFKFIS